MSRNWYLLVALGIALLLIGIICSESCIGKDNYVCNNQKQQ